MPALGQLLTALLVVTPAATLRHATARRGTAPIHGAVADIAQETQKRALVISGLGPDSRYGCGVREFVFILDLQECGYRVDIATEDGGSRSDAVLQGRPVHELLGWSTKTPSEAFRSMRWFNKSDVDAVDLEGYTAIFFFGWYWEFEKKGGEEGLEAAIMPKLESFRNRTTLMLDDVPDVRCEEETVGYRTSRFCRRLVPKAVARWSVVASRVFTLTDVDAELVADLFQRHSITDMGPVRAWPLRLQRLEMLQREEQLALGGDPSSAYFLSERRVYLTMVANDHVANREFTERLFSSGVADRWCKKSLTLMFVGTISDYVASLRPFYPGLPSSCVLTVGVQSRTVLAQRILPRTLAILNPFWRDLRSGISVKSYEALAAGVPLVTSVHGLRGLEFCGAPKLALGLKEADDVAQYADFVDRLLLDQKNYGLLTAEVLRLRTACAAQQEADVAHRACETLR